MSGTSGTSGGFCSSAMWYACSMTEPPLRPVIRKRSLNDRRVTFALKVVALVALVAVILSAILSFIGRIPSVAVIIIGAIFFTYVIYRPCGGLTRGCR